MNRKLKVKKKNTQENQETEPSFHKKRPILKEKYKNPKNWLEEEEMPEGFQAHLFSLDLDDTQD